jgi:hypothetical protein
VLHETVPDSSLPDGPIGGKSGTPTEAGFLVANQESSMRSDFSSIGLDRMDCCELESAVVRDAVHSSCSSAISHGCACLQDVEYINLTCILREVNRQN